MYFGGGMVPTYLVVKETGLINNMWALFLPGGVAVGNMIIVRNFFENSIPKEMTEAAQIEDFYTDRSAFKPLHHGGYGGVQHGGLLERLVYFHDIPAVSR